MRGQTSTQETAMRAVNDPMVVDHRDGASVLGHRAALHAQMTPDRLPSGIERSSPAVKMQGTAIDVPVASRVTP